MRTRFRKPIRIILLCSLFLYDLWLAAQIPYTHDDWDWGLDTGLNHLLNADINSRYAGNLIEVLLTRSPMLKTLFMASVFFLIPCVLTRIAVRFSERRPGRESIPSTRLLLFLLANVLLFLTPASVWRQTCGWVAGFSNFVVSGLLLLLYYLLIMRLEEHPEEKASGARGVLLVVFGALIQLFLENLSVLFFTATVFLIVRRLMKKETVGAPLLCLLIGNTLGLLLVFSSNIYRSLWETGDAVDGYRHLTVDRRAPLAVILRDLYERLDYVVLPETMNHSGVLPAAIMGAFSLLCLDRLPEGRRGRTRFLLLFLLHALFTCYFLYLWLSNRYGLRLPLIRRVELRLDGLQFILYLALVTADLFLFFRRDARSFFWLMAVWLSPVLLLAPMALINTLGARSFFTSSICYTLFLMLLAAPLLDARGKALRTVFAAGLSLVLLVCLVHYGHVYAQIGRAGRERLAVIQTATSEGAEIIELPAYPFRGYLWFPDPVNEERVAYFKAFYGIPEDVQLLLPPPPAE